jgi:predicted Zn-dependent protease
MKQWAPFALTLLLLGAALVTSERQKIDAPVGPEAMLSVVADTQRELTRLPVSFVPLSDADEIKIGDHLAKEYLREDRFSKEAPSTKVVQAYVNKVGWRVAAGAHRKLPYRFHYVSDPDFVNAFALPGGHVFIGGGLLALMDSEDELANVLGHEVEHIDHYHCAERIQTQAAIEKVPLGELLALPAEVFEEGYSKTQELEADREGTRLAVKANYSPLGAVRMFQTFDQLFQAQKSRAQSPEEELSTLALETLEGYFRSHPEPSERIAQIKTLISDEHWESKVAEQPLEVAYVYLTQRAGRALAAKHYAGAESAATRSLGLHADQIDALTILAQAQFALMEFPAALTSYRQVLKESPSDAATVGEFANSIATSALNPDHLADAAKYASASLDLQPNNAQALTVLADAQMAMGDYAASGATYQRFLNLYPAEAENVITFAASTAQRELTAHHFEKARGAAAFWLTIRPRAAEALDIEAAADLALGDFAGAAKADRDALDLTPQNVLVNRQLVWGYADALSAAKLGEAAMKDFQSFMETERSTTTSTLENQIRIEFAGLALMAGDSAPAEELARSRRGVGRSRIPPELMGRLGWWFYRAGQYSKAEVLLHYLTQMRPGDSDLRNNLAWVELENQEFDAALLNFGRGLGALEIGFAQWNTPQMGQAIALWRTHKVEEALKNFAQATNGEPRWTNPVLVRAFYSSAVAQSVAEMQAEQAKRLEAKKHNSAPKR